MRKSVKSAKGKIAKCKRCGRGDDGGETATSMFGTVGPLYRGSVIVGKAWGLVQEMGMGGTVYNREQMMNQYKALGGEDLEDEDDDDDDDAASAGLLSKDIQGA